MSKKEKNLVLGDVRKPNKSKFISFDNSIKDIVITREYEVEGETITEKVRVAKNESGYLNAVFINKFQENIEFKLNKEWISQKKADADLAYGEKNNISSILQVKVESL